MLISNKIIIFTVLINVFYNFKGLSKCNNLKYEHILYIFPETFVVFL